jgi:hypothetical protein
MTPLEVVHAMPSALNRPENRNPQENLQQSRSPLQAMKNWCKLKPELFKKQPYYLAGCDNWRNANGEMRRYLGNTGLNAKQYFGGSQWVVTRAGLTAADET